MRSHKKLGWVVFILLFVSPFTSQAAEYILRAEIHVKETQARRLEVWVPLPLEDQSQKILSLKVEAPGPFLIREEEEYGNRFLYLSLPRGNAKITYEARIERTEFHPVETPPPSPRFLLPDRLVPLKPFRDLAQTLSQGRKTPLEQLRAFYDYVVTNLRYDKSGKGWGRGDALFACTNKRGNCTDFHSLLMALARNKGIPVIFEIGLPVNREGGPIKGYHCWLKAYVDGKLYGIDASEAAKNPAKREYYFGNLDERRILLSRGRDLLLAPPQHGERLNFLYQAYAEADLRPAPDLVETRYFVSFAAP